MTEPRRYGSQVERSGYNGNAIRVVRINSVPSAASCPSLCYRDLDAVVNRRQQIWLKQARGAISNRCFTMVRDDTALVNSFVSWDAMMRHQLMPLAFVADVLMMTSR